MDCKYTVREITKSASRALSALYAKFISCGGMTYDVYNKLYKSLVEPVLYYGAGFMGSYELERGVDCVKQGVSTISRLCV